MRLILFGFGFGTLDVNGLTIRDNVKRQIKYRSTTSPLIVHIMTWGTMNLHANDEWRSLAAPLEAPFCVLPAVGKPGAKPVSE